MINTIVFDHGGVLIDWNPEYVFLKEFRGDREKMNWFFENICTSEWNEQQDAGYNLEQATLERIALFPEYERLIRMYYGEWEQMLGYELTGTVEILKKLLILGINLFLLIINLLNQQYRKCLILNYWLQLTQEFEIKSIRRQKKIGCH